MYAEMKDLKGVTNNGVSKLRQRETSLIQDQRRDQDAIMELEKKLENANSLIRSLGLSSRRHPASPPATGMPSERYEPPPATRSLRTPERYAAPPSRHRAPHPPEHASRAGSAARPRGAEGRATPPSRASLRESKVVAQLTTEKELRYKAEEIAAGVLANSKSALEARDSEIGKLRSQLFKLSHGKYNRDR